MWNAMKRLFCIFFLFLMPAGLFGQPASDSSSNPSEATATDAAVIERRVADLLRQMTLGEKIGQMSQLFWDKTLSDDRLKNGTLGSYLFLTDPHEINRVQHVAVEQSRLHIPLLFAFDVIHGFRTIFPVGIAHAASWDPAMIERIESTAALEASANGVRWIFAPMVDIARDARWGRVVEGAGEDPFLGAAMARAQVLGFQGKQLGASDHVLACVKHFAGYGAADGGRDYDSSYVPEELMRNVYLVPFHAAEEAGAGSFMSAYMDLNDVPASGNHWLLTDVLRSEWGFQGIVLSDAFAVKSLETHGFAKDPEDAAYKAFTAGVNMDMASQTYTRNLGALVKDSKVSEASIDQMVLPILEAKYDLGLFDHPYADDSKVDTVLNRPEGLALERKLASRSMVLLRNEDHALPLSKGLKKVAVIGPLADSARDIEGGWTVEGLFGPGGKSHPVTVYAGIKDKLGPSAQIALVGGPTPSRIFPSPINPTDANKPIPAPTPKEVEDWIEKAKAAARNDDVVIAVMGEMANMSGEAASRATLDLPGIQERMLEEVVATGKPVVLVLENGRPLDIRWASEHVPAILEAWYPGTQGGSAVADVLFGDVTPGGELPISSPRK